jgi:hypothetical protein
LRIAPAIGRTLLKRKVNASIRLGRDLYTVIDEQIVIPEGVAPYPIVRQTDGNFVEVTYALNPWLSHGRVINYNHTPDLNLETAMFHAQQVSDTFPGKTFRLYQLVIEWRWCRRVSGFRHKLHSYRVVRAYRGGKPQPWETNDARPEHDDGF